MKELFQLISESLTQLPIGSIGMVNIYSQQRTVIHRDAQGASPAVASVGATAAQSVCAVMVTYHAGAETLENIRIVLPEVQALVVVDNGSAAGEIASLREASQASGF